MRICSRVDKQNIQNRGDNKRETGEKAHKFIQLKTNISKQQVVTSPQGGRKSFCEADMATSAETAP